MQRWQGALADSLALEPSQSVSLSLVQGAEAEELVTRQAARREGTGSALSQLPANFPPAGNLPQVRPSTVPSASGFCACY